MTSTLSKAIEKIKALRNRKENTIDLYSDKYKDEIEKEQLIEDEIENNDPNYEVGALESESESEEDEESEEQEEESEEEEGEIPEEMKDFIVPDKEQEEEEEELYKYTKKPDRAYKKIVYYYQPEYKGSGIKKPPVKNLVPLPPVVAQVEIKKEKEEIITPTPVISNPQPIIIKQEEQVEVKK